MALRDEFPVLEKVAYLNAGTDGPIPRAAAELVQQELNSSLADGRTWPHFERRMQLQTDLRAGYAQLMNCEPDDVAVTTGTSFGLGCVLAGMDLGTGDEIVTSDNEHPGLLGPLIAARHRGATVKPVPFAELANAVTATTTLVAASHVNWITGELAPDLSSVNVPVILDGAQGSGAVPVDVQALGCAAYAAAGQKWLCGADGTGMLYVQPEFGERVRTIAPTYGSFEDASRGLESTLRAGGRRFDAALSREALAFSFAALEVLVAADLDASMERAADLAEQFATGLADAGYTVAPRGRSTLVAWEYPEPAEARQRLADAGIAVRDLPGFPYLRASVGAWNDESDLQKLLAAL
ncbi:aminotransferase class V-fold PLP-dependent enzyme [Solirubrobacter ginsenosidimutans]|uniref:Aminotransferase class V-fold PLP-dependent enzyme n=1 Tax=Solirubrobacter ginsenosidimutans TaxID=490573 RepID=A0A9X3MYX4_9ACTN|nr:aminotransferase class V-fold PLP-dependent enzyme [Solirubrobacter ginsenosidimutans]MDA0164186.1 aminotransferase class V-fold PLP-dependent enzyme [Solirubrobacter ginsenosidimutans]